MLKSLKSPKAVQNLSRLSRDAAAVASGLLSSRELIAGSIYDKHSAGASIRQISNTRCFTITNMIQVCSNFRLARVFIINTRPDAIILFEEVGILISLLSGNFRMSPV